jgi:hypothetical protein
LFLGYAEYDPEKEKIFREDKLSLEEPLTELHLPIKNSRRLTQRSVIEVKLLSEKGLTLLVDSLQELKFHGPGHEVYDLRSLILAYEQWAHNLLPDLEFKLFAKRAQKLGGNARIKTKLADIRHNFQRNGSFEKE